MLLFELGRGDASERGVEAFGVEPGDALDDRELELSARLPDAVSDQLGLEAVDTTAPTVTNVTLNNSGVLGQANDNDTAVVTFSDVMDATTFCGNWSNGSTQNVNGNNQVTVTITDSGSNDLLTVTWNTCGAGGSHFGTVALNANYVSTTRTFGGSASADRSEVTWNPATKQFTIQLGAPSGTTLSSVVASTPSYTPDAALTDLAGASCNGDGLSGPLLPALRRPADASGCRRSPAVARGDILIRECRSGIVMGWTRSRASTVAKCGRP